MNEHRAMQTATAAPKRVSFSDAASRAGFTLPSRGLGAFNLVTLLLCILLPAPDGEQQLQIGDLPQWKSIFHVSSGLLLLLFGWPMLQRKTPPILAWTVLVFVLVLYTKSATVDQRFSPITCAYGTLVFVVGNAACISRPLIITIFFEHGGQTSPPESTFWSLSFAAELLPTIVYSTYSIMALTKQTTDLLGIEMSLPRSRSSAVQMSPIWFCVWVGYLLKRTDCCPRLQSAMCCYSILFWLIGAPYGLTSAHGQLFMFWTFVLHLCIYTLQGATSPLFHQLGRGSQAFAALLTLNASANVCAGLLFMTQPQSFYQNSSWLLVHRPTSQPWWVSTLWQVYVLGGIHLMFPASVLVYMHDSTKLVVSLRYLGKPSGHSGMLL